MTVLFKMCVISFLILVLGFTTACSDVTPPPQPQPENIPSANITQECPPVQPTMVCPALEIIPTAVPDLMGSVELPEGFGIIGDSFYDEYQGNDNRGGRYHKTTFNLVEILVHTRHFNLGPWGTRDEPRRTGYAYNWARSGSTSNDMIEEGQHIGLAEQVRDGKVSYVLIGIGANDFNPYYKNHYKNIYDGTMTDDELRQKIQRAIGNVTLAVDTIQDAGAKGIILTHFVQWDMDPFLEQQFPNASGRKRVAEAIDEVNRGIQSMAVERGIYTINQIELSEKILSLLAENRYYEIGDQSIDFGENGDEPQFSRLGDGQHLGTVMSGISANWYIIEPLKEEFGIDIPPLTDEEILRIAGFVEE